MSDSLSGDGARAVLGQALAALEHARQLQRGVIDSQLGLWVYLEAVRDVRGHIIDFVLAGMLGGSDVAARVGGDEFVIVAGGLTDEDAAVEIAIRIANGVTRPIVRAGHVVVPTLSIGLALADPGDLLRRADAALYHRKQCRNGETQPTGDGPGMCQLLAALHRNVIGIGTRSKVGPHTAPEHPCGSGAGRPEERPPWPWGEGKEVVVIDGVIASSTTLKVSVTVSARCRSGSQGHRRARRFRSIVTLRGPGLSDRLRPDGVTARCASRTFASDQQVDVGLGVPRAAIDGREDSQVTKSATCSSPCFTSCASEVAL